MEPWEQRVARHIAEWSEHFRQRGKLPLAKFAYHFTDVQNAALILRGGRLLSRAARAMVVDNASPAVIAKTLQDHTRFVRLYFRPRTPTQWHNEGIRPPAYRSMGAHCPVPVFFIFNLQPLLCRPDVYVSDGNMGSARVSFDLAPVIFGSIPFDHVYHDGPVSPDQKEIKFRRSAEILVRDQLDLRDLRSVACRSEAERQTLLHLIGDSPWKDRVYVVGGELFHRDWFYVEDAHSETDELVIKIHRTTSRAASSHNVRIRMEAEERETGAIWTWEGEHNGAEFRRRFVGDLPGRAKVTVWLEEALAFQNVLQFTDDIPF